MVRIITVLTISLAIFSSGYAGAWAGDLPDPLKTPGAINPDVTQDNIDKTICVDKTRPKIFISKVYPGHSFMNSVKRKQLAELGVTDSENLYAEDHLIPLALGGHPRDERNLWPQLWSGEWGAHTKDRLEYKMFNLVCSRKLPLAQAQREIATDWIAAYKKYCPTQEECSLYEDQ